MLYTTTRAGKCYIQLQALHLSIYFFWGLTKENYIFICDYWGGEDFIGEINYFY